MFEIDMSLTIAGIVALSAIISPVVVTILNNRHAFKMKKLEIQSEKQAQVLEQYLISTGKIIVLRASVDAHDYQANKGLLYTYASKKAWAKIDKLDKQIREKRFDDAKETLEEVCKAISNTK